MDVYAIENSKNIIKISKNNFQLYINNNQN